MGRRAHLSGLAFSGYFAYRLALATNHKKVKVEQKKILIVGGGFGGIRTALDLAKNKPPDVKIVLLSDKPHFEYHATLYRVVTGRSPLQVCIPLAEIFAGQNVEVVIDTVIAVNPKAKTLDGSSGSHYSFDYLVLALGSETAYFNIPGLAERAFGFKSITEALRLKRHLHGLFEGRPPKPINIVVVGGGASGVELAGELAVYTAGLAKRHNLDESLVSIDLVEAAPRVLPTMPPDVSERVRRRLQNLGVNLFVNRQVIKEEMEELSMADMKVWTKTVIWTAGVKPNHLYSEIQGLKLDPKGRVVVDEHLQAEGASGVFVIGDAAATIYAGMAQTALHQGRFVAAAIKKLLKGQRLFAYYPKKPLYAIPVGPGWAAAVVGAFRFYFWAGWLARRSADLRFFLSILPFRKALAAFDSEKTLCETCVICVPEGGETI